MKYLHETVAVEISKNNFDFGTAGTTILLAPPIEIGCGIVQ